MSIDDRKAKVRQYLSAPRPAGLYSVRNTETGRLLFGSTRDLPGMLNRQRFQLEMGVHPDRELQADWNEFGAGAFAFEVLDRLDGGDDPTLDLTEDLRVLKAMWLQTLTESSTPLYRTSTRTR